MYATSLKQSSLSGPSKTSSSFGKAMDLLRSMRERIPTLSVGQSVQDARSKRRSKEIDEYLHQLAQESRSVPIAMLGTIFQKIEMTGLLRFLANGTVTGEARQDARPKILRLVLKIICDLEGVLNTVPMDSGHPLNVSDLRIMIEEPTDEDTIRQRLTPLIPDLSKQWSALKVSLRDIPPEERGRIFACRRYYFMDHLDRIVQPNYVPADMDVLELQTTEFTGQIMAEYQFDHLRLHVGTGPRNGMQTETYWRVLDNSIAAIVYPINLPSYLEVRQTDSKDNPLESALDMSDMILYLLMCIRKGLRATFILLLTEFDRFAELLQQIPFAELVPSYHGANDPVEIVCHLVGRFASHNNEQFNIFPMVVANFEEQGRTCFAQVLQSELLQNVLSP